MYIGDHHNRYQSHLDFEYYHCKLVILQVNQLLCQRCIIKQNKNELEKSAPNLHKIIEMLIIEPFDKMKGNVNDKWRCTLDAIVLVNFS